MQVLHVSIHIFPAKCKEAPQFIHFPKLVIFAFSPFTKYLLISCPELRDSPVITARTVCLSTQEIYSH